MKFVPCFRPLSSFVDSSISDYDGGGSGCGEIPLIFPLRVREFSNNEMTGAERLPE